MKEKEPCWWRWQKLRFHHKNFHLEPGTGGQDWDQHVSAKPVCFEITTGGNGLSEKTSTVLQFTYILHQIHTCCVDIWQNSGNYGQNSSGVFFPPEKPLLGVRGSLTKNLMPFLVPREVLGTKSDQKMMETNSDVRTP